MRFYWLIIGVLSTWRVTHLLIAEDGPYRLLARLRRQVSKSVFVDLLSCFYCLSLWIAGPLAWLIGEEWKERTLLWLALSGGAILLERVTDGGHRAPLTAYYKEDNDGVLRKE
jgi:hypothetical protein